MILRSADSLDLRINAAFSLEFGLTKDELRAQPLLEWIHPDDREVFARLLEAGEGSARARHRAQRNWQPLNWQVKRQDGRAFALGLTHSTPERSITPPAAGVSVVNSTLAKTLEAMVRIVEAKTDGLRCSILLIDANHDHVTVGAGPSFPKAYNAAVEGLRIGPAVGSCGTAAFWNVPVIVENIGSDPLWKNLRDAAAIAGVSSCWSVPITATNEDQVLGAMALYDTVPRGPTRGELDVLETAARMVGLAIERDRLEEQLRQATKFDAIGMLAGGIAHDFNNLLSVIIGNVELSMPALPPDSDASLSLEQAVTACKTAAELCNQMLAYAGKAAVTAEPLDCNAIVQEIGALLAVAISKKVTLRFELHEAPMGGVADGSQIRQVLMNLITNASEAIGDADGVVVLGSESVALSAEDLEQRYGATSLEPGEYVRLWGRDTGSGITPETEAKIFDPFFTTKPAGRGLGLAAVQGIVRSHGGTLVLDTEVGKGTTFSVLLPLVTLRGARSSAAPGTGAAPSSARILVVDDEPAVRQVLVRILQGAGYKVIEARDGREGVEVFRSQADAIDCVLLDLSMPKMDGAEAFARMQEIRSDVLFFLLSGFAEQEILDRFRDARLAGVIQKPPQMDLLLRTVAEALRS